MFVLKVPQKHAGGFENGKNYAGPPLSLNKFNDIFICHEYPKL